MYQLLSLTRHNIHHGRRNGCRRVTTSRIMNRSKWGVGVGSVLLGLGLGGFFDSIILHQILQWHHMLSAVKPIDTVRGLEINTLGDGLFHLGTYSLTVAGLVLLWRRLHQQHRPVSTVTLIGGLLLGWGVFNLV